MQNTHTESKVDPRPHFYTPHEAAEILRISMPTFYRLVRTGGIFARKVGTQLRISASEIDRLAGTQEVEE